MPHKLPLHEEGTTETRGVPSGAATPPGTISGEGSTLPADSAALVELLLPQDPPEHEGDFAPVVSADLAEDAALIERARTDPSAFGMLYERYVERIYSYVYHRVGNSQDAEDLTARTFHRALSNLDSYEDRGLPFAAWLFRIAHNLVANWHRDRSRRRFLSLDRIWAHRNDSDDPEGALEKKETHDALWSAINHLPSERRDLLIYKFSSRMSNTEIGQLMDKSESAIKSLYFRTLAALRKELEARGWGADTLADPIGVHESIIAAETEND